MKRNNLRSGAIRWLSAGLLLVITAPIIGRHLQLPDMVKGFLSGIGLAIEFVGLVKLQRTSGKQCRFRKRYN